VSFVKSLFISATMNPESATMLEHTHSYKDKTKYILAQT